MQVMETWGGARNTMLVRDNVVALLGFIPEAEMLRLLLREPSFDSLLGELQHGLTEMR